MGPCAELSAHYLSTVLHVHKKAERCSVHRIGGGVYSGCDRIAARSGCVSEVWCECAGATLFVVDELHGACLGSEARLAKGAAMWKAAAPQQRARGVSVWGCGLQIAYRLGWRTPALRTPTWRGWAITQGTSVPSDSARRTDFRGAAKTHRVNTKSQPHKFKDNAAIFQAIPRRGIRARSTLSCHVL